MFEALTGIAMPVQKTAPTEIPPPAGTISHPALLVLRRNAQSVLHSMLGGVTNEIIEYVLDRQKVTPICIEVGNIRAWAARYRGAVQRAAIAYAEALSQAIGMRKGLGRKDLIWIRREAAGFFRLHISLEAKRFIEQSSFGLVEIQDVHKADSYFDRILTKYGKIPVMQPIRDKLTDAQELYGMTKMSPLIQGSPKPTALQKLAHPEAHPLMDAKEVATVCGVSRSTVSRWAEEGKLRRVSMGKKGEKRARLQVTTRSVKALLTVISE